MISATSAPRRTGGGLHAPASLIKTAPDAEPVQVLAFDEQSSDAARGHAGPTLAQEVLRDLRGGPRTLARAVLLAEILGPAPGLASPGEEGANRRW